MIVVKISIFSVKTLSLKKQNKTKTHSLGRLSALEEDTSGDLEKKFVSLSHKRLLWRSRMMAWKGFHLPSKALQCGALCICLPITTPLSSGYLETIVSSQ